MRFLALILMLLVLTPRTALAALSLGCERPMECACCQPKHTRTLAHPKATLTRAPCCAARTSHDAAPAVTLPPLGSTLDLAALAPTLRELPAQALRPSAALAQYPRAARGPPAPRCPIFLRNLSLLH